MLTLIEARPGAGKTTALRRLAELLRARGVTLAGFVTEEIRERGKRVGFSIETFGGERGTLAHIDHPGHPRVGKYGVDLGEFERLALPALRAPADAAELVEREIPVVATVQAARHPFTDQLKRRPDADLIRLTRENRDELAPRLAERLAHLYPADRAP